MTDDQNKRVVIGMSGGVDSSVAAALLKEQGYDVVGITLKLWAQDCSARAEDKCCGPQAVMDARAVCHTLGIPFYLVDESDAFKHDVIDYFIDEYRHGKTPNPCVLCNERLKFGGMLDRARKLGAEYVATGHYARVEPSEDGSRMLLKRGVDPKKDQSYFLFSLNQQQLRATLMPLGGMTKEQTRAKARLLGLKTATKKESMDICFVPDNDYGKFLVSAGAVTKHPGQVVDKAGNVIGQHDGVEFYTIGQRKGLGIASTRPLYVININSENNQVVLGDVQDLDRSEFFVRDCNWIAYDTPPVQFEALTKIRYKHPGVVADVFSLPDRRARVVTRVPQRAITPGQACVFYQDDTVLGGGWIEKMAG